MTLKKSRFLLAEVATIVAVVSFASVSLAVPISSVTNPLRTQNSWVSDTANMLSPQTEDKLNQMIDAFEVKTGGEIAVVTVKDTKPSASPKKFATHLFNKWGIGKPGQDNGVLLLISKNERRTEIKPGKGLSRRLTKSRSRQILKQYVTPKFKRKQFDAGTIAAVEQISRVAQTTPPKRTASGGSLTGWPAVFAVLLALMLPLVIALLPVIFVVFAIYLVKRGGTSWTNTGRSYSDSSYSDDDYSTDYDSSYSSYDNSDSSSSYDSSYSSNDDYSSDFGGGSSDYDSGGGDSW